MSKFGNYIQESYDELLHKVTWPSWDELQKTSWVVIVGLVITSLILLGMDMLSKEFMKLIYSMLG